MIPKRVFFIFSDNKLSWTRYISIKSCIKLNPGYEFFLYTFKQKNRTHSWIDDVKQDFFNYDGKDYMNELLKLPIITIPINDEFVDEDLTIIHNTDLLRLQILITKGGFYADTDILWLKSLDTLYKDIQHTDVGFMVEEFFYNCFLFGSPNNRFYELLHHQAKMIADNHTYQSAGTHVFYYFTEYEKTIFKDNGAAPEMSEEFILQRMDYLKTWFGDLVFYRLPLKQIVPYLFNQTQLIFEKPNQPIPDSLGIHWFGGDNISQKYNNIMNESNIDNFNNLFIKVAKNYV